MFDLNLDGERYNDLDLSLLGSHQVSNAALAVAAAMRLNSHGFSVKEKDVRKALSTVRVPGRFEIVRERPLVIMDGAHNPMKIGALVKTLKERYPDRKVSFLFAAKKDKNVKDMIEALSPLASGFYFTSFESTTDFGKRMSYDPKELKCFSDVDCEVIPDAHKALGKALSDARSGGAICITGSFYLVGELRSAALR
jgi:dihydrofolate synthase/folylpolyglutamate synthase